jgi:UDP-N-acetylmuramoyl-L-alanyl-D-glutamate--2,6-diaminopimelate ligase
MLHEAGYKTGLMTTVAYGVGDDIKPQIAHMTTVSVPLLHKRLKMLKSAGAEYVVLEVTSHALAQNRVWGIPISIAVMTNLTHEHLDYHGTFERYRDAKLKLFTMAGRNKKGLQVGIANADDDNGQLFASKTKNPILYGIHDGDLRAENVALAPSGVSYVANSGEDSYKITTQIPGSFNVYNSLAAVGVGRALGLSKEQIEQGIAALEGVEGRMTRIDEGQDFDVIVDFAHTPDSFEKLFKDLKPAVKGKFIVLFGSAGRRDEAKRAIQGRLAGEYADVVVVTEEDDRDIDGLGIMDEIAGGAEEKSKVRDTDLFLVHDRTEAIEFAIKHANAGDTVLLLGKGHEKTIERADGEHPWDEIGTTRAILKNL